MFWCELTGSTHYVYHAMYVCHNTTNQKQTRRVPSHGNGLGICLVVGAWRAEETAPPGIEVCDALALYQSITQLFALLNVPEISPRVLEVFLSGARVALNLGADLLPYAWFLGYRCRRCACSNIFVC